MSDGGTGDLDALPHPPHGLVPLAAGSARLVTDADEETFLLYTLSPPPQDQRGLGFVNGTADLLRIAVPLQGESSDAVQVEALSVDDASDGPQKPAKQGRAVKRSAKAAKKSESSAEEDSVVVEVRQDVTSLRSTTGDTGSVVWRSSLLLASLILRRLSAPALLPGTVSCDEDVGTLLEPELLARARVLELGAGTGVLPMLLFAHPELRSPSAATTWLATDQEAMLGLLQRNIARQQSGFSPAGARLDALPLDWNEALAVRQSGSQARQDRLRRAVFAPFEHRPSCADSPDPDADEPAWPDLLLASDCIYNPSLFPALLATIDVLAAPRRTLVLVICELRSAESVREFLAQWLAHGADEGPADGRPQPPSRWCICSLEQDVLGARLAKGNAAWLGWKR